MSERHAIIDIGSNSVRLVVYGGPLRAPAVLLNEKVTARLGKGVAANGMLSDKSRKAALGALGRYAKLLELMDVRDVETVATAAVRDAANGPEFLNAVTALGLWPRLLSGPEEARASARGVQAAFPGERGVAGDLGGGSLELTSLEGDTCGGGVTVPFGTLRLPQLREAGGPRFSAALRKDLRAGGWSCPAGQRFYAVGGSWRALARTAMHQLQWPVDDPHGFELEPDAALKLCRSLARGGLAPIPGIAASRLASLPDAAALMAALISELHPSKLVFSSWGLREGLFYDRLPHETRVQDPLIASVSAFAEGFDASPLSATMIAGWTAEASPGARAEDERLRLAATMLALAAMRIEPNLRPGLAMEWALRKRWIGIDGRGRAMMAMAALANSGRTAVPEELLRLTSPDDLREATAWGLAIRLCRRFGGCVARSLSGSELIARDGKLILELSEGLRALYNDPVEKDLRTLAAFLELEPTLEFIDEPVTA